MEAVHEPQLLLVTGNLPGPDSAESWSLEVALAAVGSPRPHKARHSITGAFPHFTKYETASSTNPLPPSGSGLLWTL